MNKTKKTAKKIAGNASKPKPKPSENSGHDGHKLRFNQLLDDAVLGVKKK